MKYEVITTDKGKVIIDESVKGKRGYCFNFGLSKIDKLSRNYEKHSSEWNYCRKILCTINFSLDKDIPMVIIEDELQNLIPVKCLTTTRVNGQLMAYVKQ